MHFYSTGNLIFVYKYIEEIRAIQSSINPESFVRGVEAGHNWSTSKPPFKWHSAVCRASGSQTLNAGLVA